MLPNQRRMLLASLLLILGVISHFSYGSANLINKPGDTIKVAMKTLVKMPYMRSTQPGILLDKADEEEYKGILKNTDLYGILVFDFQPYSDKPVKQSIAVLSIIKGNKKIIICDANNDKDFSNDIIQEYDLNRLAENEDKLDLISITRVNYQYYYKNKVIDKSLNVKIRPYSSSHNFPDSIQQKLQVYMLAFQEREGYFNLNNKEYRIALPKGRFLGGDFSQAVVFLSEKGGDNFQIDPFFKIGDSYNLNTKRIKFYSATEFGDTVTLLISKPDKKTLGYRIGDYINPFSFKDITTGKLINTGKSKDYILLDFWGTWCVPCIEGIPELKAFNEKYKTHLEIISVANDVDVEKVKEFLKKRDLPWIHKFENRKSLKATDITKILSVGCFPTFILLGPNNEILVRDCGSEALQQAELVMAGSNKKK